MTKPPPTLADLRREIDRIDEAMHRLLMERGEIIDTLIATKKTAESGSAFRPAREADMMKRLVERHRGLLPLDTVESIWRVIIATFTYVQAPFSVHADLSAGEAAMRDSARFHFGFTVPFVTHSAQPAWSRRSRRRAAIWGSCRRRRLGAWWTALEGRDAPKIIARLPFVERADHPAGLQVFAIARPNPDALVTDVETWSVRVAGWGSGGHRARSIHQPKCGGAGPRFRRRALLVSVPQGQGSTRSISRWSRPAPRCAPRLSSAATRPVIPSPPKARPVAAEALNPPGALE